MGFPCPHCQEQMYTRTSKLISCTSREVYYHCTNPHCGHVAVAVTELMRSVVAPNFPNPACSLRVVKPTDPRPPNRQPDDQLQLTL
ncbi:ogr/Delta-like zinc finger family protein [Chitiniphilus eburneus]|uniref:ogr/Delta-like zinc finger family protein n=1 Tax=Chitiniphilus eburneus TaxID=2571148 RepID=UPI0035CF8913